MKIKTMSILLPAALLLGGCAAAATETPGTVSAAAETQSAAEALSVPDIQTETAAHTSHTAADAPVESSARVTAEAAPSPEETPESLIKDSAADCAAEYDCISPSAEAQGDVISIAVSTSFIDYSIRYGSVIFLEDESTAGTLYFKAVSPGKDNIVISENSENGIIRTEYIAVINDDLTAELYISGGEAPAGDLSKTR